MLEDLTAELRAYVAAHDLPQMSADELALEIRAVLTGEESAYIAAPGEPERGAELYAAHHWLGDFCDRWEAGEECARHGHHDTGRGVCAICGYFLTVK